MEPLITADDVIHASPSPYPNIQRNPTQNRKKGKGKGKPNAKKQQAIKEKIQSLMVKLKPIPFKPGKIPDFSNHEKLLKKLGLWDFFHIDFDRNIRVDLIAQLIASYEPKTRASKVEDCRIKVSRADFARAFKLKQPGRKKSNTSAGGGVDVDSECEALSDDSIGFVRVLVDEWVLLHAEDDTWMMPNEVAVLYNVIKDGHPEKVDWGSLLWIMVEKELKQGGQLRDCYYASHLQHLIKSQREDLFLDVKEEIYEDTKAPDEEGVCLTEGPSTELTLGQDSEKGGEIIINDVEKCKESEPEEQEVEEEEQQQEQQEQQEQGQWLLNEQNELGGHFMQHCSSGNAEVFESFVDQKMEEHEPEEQEVKEEEQKEQGQWLLNDQNVLGEHFMQRCSSGNVEVFENSVDQKKEEHGPEEQEVKEQKEQGQWLLNEQNELGEHFMQHCSSGNDEVFESFEELKKEDAEEMNEDEDGNRFHIFPRDYPLEGAADGFTGNLLQAMGSNQMSFDHHHHLQDDQLCNQSSVDIGSIPSFFSNMGKRVIKHDSNDSNKKLRINDSWNHINNKQVNFEMCMEQMQNVTERARMLYEEKEQALEHSNMNQQILLSELQKRDEVIEHLHKTRVEEIQKKQGEIFRLERELYLMESLLEGYRKALKETQRTFSEYREKVRVEEEPTYKNTGLGGLMLTGAEIEKLKKKEEEYKMCQLLAEQMVKEFEDDWVGRLNEYAEKINGLEMRLTGFEDDLKGIVELYEDWKIKKTGEEEVVDDEGGENEKEPVVNPESEEKMDEGVEEDESNV